MGNIPSKPVVVNQEWTNGVTKLNQTNLTSGVNQNITNIKTAVDGIIDALGGPGADPGNFEEITWADLKALRDAGQLVPGKQYRITDYVTTTAKEDTRSAGHQFDVIVNALSADKLSEEALAILHAGDTYFANSNLNVWKLWYSIDNNTSRFDWADATNGKGVIYRMIDEFGNDIPYDFKNIQFKRYKGDIVTEEVDGHTYQYPKFINMYDFYADIYEDEQLANMAQMTYDMLRKKTRNSLITNPFLYSLGTTGYTKVGDLSEELVDFLTDSSHGALSVDDYIVAICGEEDYDGYLCVLVIDHSTPFYFYTFSDGVHYPSTGAITNIRDTSLYKGACLNIFEGSDSEYSLLFNVFIGSSFNNNTVGSNFKYNTMLGFSDNNIVGVTFMSNTIGSSFSYNTVNGSFYNNVVWIFSYNNIESSFGYNFVDSFEQNVVGDGFTYNIVKDGFSHNTVGSDFYGNIVGSDFRYNILGNDFSYNTFGSFSEGAFIQHCIFDDGVQYISLISSDVPSIDNYIQNVHIHLGVKGTSSSNPLVISVPRNLPYETEYYLDNLGNLTVSNFSTHIAWKDLKDLRDAGRLVPGKQYRITDYLTAVEQPECRSAGHPFDVVVTALTANTLSENANAVIRYKDHYFVESLGAVWKPGVTLSDVELLYKMTDNEDTYNPPQPQIKKRTFTKMDTMVNPATGVGVPYLFEPDPDGGGEPSGNDRRYLFIGEYKFNGVIYDQWEECYVDGTPARSVEGFAYYELTNVVVDCEQSIFEKAKLSAWKLKYCLDNDYDRFGFAVRHDVIKVQGTDTFLYLRYPSLDGDSGFAWAYLNGFDNKEIEDPSVGYDNPDTTDIIYTSTLSVNIGDTLDMQGEPVTVAATRIGKGVIYEMEDEWGNKLPYDFKNVQFKRYKVTHSTSAYDDFDGKYVGCKDINGNWREPQGYIIDAQHSSKWCYTFNWYNENGECEDYSIVGNISIYNDDDAISGCYNNVFGICVEYDLGPEVDSSMNRMYLGNNVVWDDYGRNDGTSYGFYSNIIGDAFFCNTVWEYFCSNTIGCGFMYNTVGNSFYNNTIGTYFNYNTVGNEFYSNTIGSNFGANTVGNSFYSNTVGNDFYSNTIGSAFSSNAVGNNIQNNTVGEYFEYNMIGNFFVYNVLGNYIKWSSIKDGVEFITLDAPSSSRDNYLEYITIGLSVQGESRTNHLVITPTRNADYEQEYVSANKVVRQV